MPKINFRVLKMHDLMSVEFSVASPPVLGKAQTLSNDDDFTICQIFPGQPAPMVLVEALFQTSWSGASADGQPQRATIVQLYDHYELPEDQSLLEVYLQSDGTAGGSMQLGVTLKNSDARGAPTLPLLFALDGGSDGLGSPLRPHYLKLLADNRPHYVAVNIYQNLQCGCGDPLHVDVFVDGKLLVTSEPRAYNASISISDARIRIGTNDKHDYFPGKKKTLFSLFFIIIFIFFFKLIFFY